MTSSNLGSISHRFRDMAT